MSVGPVLRGWWEGTGAGTRAGSHTDFSTWASLALHICARKKPPLLHPVVGDEMVSVLALICFDYCAKGTHGHFPAQVGPSQTLQFHLQPYCSHLGQFSVPQKRHILSTWDLQAVSSSDGHILLPSDPSPPSPGSFTQCSLTCWLKHHFPGKAFSPDQGEYLAVYSHSTSGFLFMFLITLVTICLLSPTPLRP